MFNTRISAIAVGRLLGGGSTSRIPPRCSLGPSKRSTIARASNPRVSGISPFSTTNSRSSVDSTTPTSAPTNPNHPSTINPLPTSPSPITTVPPTSPTLLYTAPLTNTFRYLKIFSLSSLALSTALSPFIFILESSLPFAGRCFLAGVAVSTTTLSTLLISYFTSAYVTSIHLNPSSHFPSPSTPTPPHTITYTSPTSPPTIPYTHTLSTISIFATPLTTRITSVGSLEGSGGRPLTTWRLREGWNESDAATDSSHPESTEIERASKAQQTKAEPKILAWTENSKGKEIGRWVMDPLTKRGKAIGRPVRYFNVHAELMKEGM